MMKILLLEDDMTLHESLKDFLQENDFSVISAYDGEEAQDMIYENKIDLMLLDVNVPNINGFELLRLEREKQNQTPAIFITSLDNIDDVEKGFLSGGNDYIRKPFSLKELLLRVQNLLKQKPNGKINIDKNIDFDTDTNTLFLGEQEYVLQNKEALLLKLFLENREKIISHEIILNSLWNYDEMPSDQALRTYIKNLRKFLGKQSIVSFKKLGYKFTTE